MSQIEVCYLRNSEGCDLESCADCGYYKLVVESANSLRQLKAEIALEQAAEKKEIFIEGFLAGKGCTLRGLKRHGEWKCQPIGNKFVEAFYWRGKEIKRFVMEIRIRKDYAR